MYVCMLHMLVLEQRFKPSEPVGLTQPLKDNLSFRTFITMVTIILLCKQWLNN